MKYFVESYGCTMNYGEGDQLSERMCRLGYTKACSAEEADIVVLNTCTVVDTTEKRMIRRMAELKSSGKQIIVTGCMAKVQINRITIRLPDSLVVAPEDYASFSDQVSERYGCGTPVDYRVEGISGIMPIAQGCLGNCTYCITRFARGGLKSYPEEELVSRFKHMVDNGTKEILVTAQDTACYGRESGTDLAELMTSLLKTPGEYRVRIGMMNPNNLYPILNKLLDAIDDPRVYRFFHIPVQSGSDIVLDAMKRHYTVDKFNRIVDRLRSRYPDISIATDIISGFPGETEEDHMKSMDLIRTLRADTVNITRFSVRPGTEAASMKPTHGRISKERSGELTDIKNRTEYDVNSKLIGRSFRVLVTERGKNDSVIARTQNYRPVALGSNIPLGTFLDVEVTGCEPTYLLGRVLNN
jgi:threonylcarbamoyladenosine tRNA methylthiotransferase CDKAL1